MIFTATLLQVLFSNASLTSPQAPLTQKHSQVNAHKYFPKPAWKAPRNRSAAFLALWGCCFPALRAWHPTDPSRKPFSSSGVCSNSKWSQGPPIQSCGSKDLERLICLFKGNSAHEGHAPSPSPPHKCFWEKRTQWRVLSTRDSSNPKTSRDNTFIFTKQQLCYRKKSLYFALGFVST